MLKTSALAAYRQFQKMADVTVPEYTPEQLAAIQEVADKGGDVGAILGGITGAGLGVAGMIPLWRLAGTARHPAVGAAIGATGGLLPLAGAFGGTLLGRRLAEKTSALEAKLAADEDLPDWVKAYQQAGWHVPKMTRVTEELGRKPWWYLGLPAVLGGGLGAALGAKGSLPSAFGTGLKGGLLGGGAGAALGAGVGGIGRAIDIGLEKVISEPLAEKMLANPKTMRELGWKRQTEIPRGQDPWF